MQETYAPALNNTNGSLGLEAPGQSAQLFTYDLFGCMTGVTANDTDSYYQFDGHGDTVQLTSASGTVTRDYRYDAFGSQLREDETDANPFRYCGEYWDVETGNIYVDAVGKSKKAIVELITTRFGI